MISLMIWTYVTIVLASFVGMEFVARGMHKYVMHGFLWNLHKDHHYPTNSTFQRNDAFGLIFLAVAITLVALWFRTGGLVFLSVAVGMAVYGASYLTVHDMIIHDRYTRMRAWGMRNRYFRRLIEVHDVHHKEGEGNWGFLFVIPGLDKIPKEQMKQAQ